MKHWRLEDVPWDRFDRARVDPDLVPIVKAAAMVERNGLDYGAYLQGVFRDDPDFAAAAAAWAVEEVQHGETLGRWAMLADPTWDYAACFQRYRAGFPIDLKAELSVRGSKTGELISRCVVESGTSSYYSAIGDQADEPVLKEICRLIASDEFRHFKLFYDHLRRYLTRERIGFWRRLRIGAGRVGETEDDELAFAYHCSAETPGEDYDHARCLAGYMARAMAAYRYHHLERAVGMMMKAVGLSPRGRISAATTWCGWQVMQFKQRKYARANAGRRLAA